MTDDQILALCQRWAEAEQGADAPAIDSLLADDFVAVGPLGFTLSKGDWLARHTSGDMRYEAFQFSEARARAYGAAAVVVARHTARATYRGQPTPSDLRATVIVVEQAEGWRVAGIHMSFIAGTPGAPPVPGRP